MKGQFCPVLLSLDFIGALLVQIVFFQSIVSCSFGPLHLLIFIKMRSTASICSSIASVR
ncbi:hypothetical protein V6Z12_A13G144400 [Gossypium hirsutum]